MPQNEGYNTLSQDVNKARDERAEGVIGPLSDELSLEMKDEELIVLKNTWTSRWESFNSELEKKQNENEEYWLGKQSKTSEKRPLVDNIIFESFETFLPIATRQKPEPTVDSDNTEAGNALANNVRRFLSKKSDDLAYTLKLKQVVRFWGLYFVGVLKVGYSMSEDDVACTPVRPQKLVLDPDAIIEDCEYKGEYVGEEREDIASDLVKRFPDKAEIIKNKVKDKMGTKVKYMEWWHDEYTFFTLDNDVLAKSKNPHWNYDTSRMVEPMDEFGNYLDPVVVETPGKNHFKTPKKPYIFLSIFNIGKHPVDDTNLIQQNLALQDLINKRLAQIDKNADSTNGSIAVSGDFFTKEQAAGVSEAARRGGTFFVPTGDVNKAMARISAPALPNFVYESLIDYRNELRNIFGTRGSAPQGTIGEKTVGGKLIVKEQDSDRIGGGVAVFLEQFSDKFYNWLVQLMYVYYDEPHLVTVLGEEKKTEYIRLSKDDFIADLTVSVKEGSMVPRDPLTRRNEAIDLWNNKAIDPITFFDRLDFPNPRESAKQLYLWQNDPIRLFPDLMQEEAQALVEEANAVGQDIDQAQVEVEPPDLNSIPIQ